MASEIAQILITDMMYIIDTEEKKTDTGLVIKHPYK